MQKQIFLLILGIFILSSLASSQVIIDFPVEYAIQESNSSFNHTGIGIEDSSILVYSCLNSICTAVNSNPLNINYQNIGNIVRINFPNSPSQGAKYAVYFFHQDYIGWQQINLSIPQSANNGHYNQTTNSDLPTIYLSRKQEKAANITNFIATNDSSCVYLSTDIVSPVTDVSLTNIILRENVSVQVTFQVQLNGATIHSNVTNYIMEYSENKSLNYGYCGLNSGNYSFFIRTDISDQKIINSLTDIKSFNLTIPGENGNEGNETNQTGDIYINIISPQNTTYNYNLLPINIDSNGTSTWYNWNGTNITYYGAISVLFPNGTHTLHAWANNSTGAIAYTNVTFTINPSSTGNETNLTGLYVDIISPENITYTNNTILVNISHNGTSAWFSWNGTVVPYTGPVYVTFNNGSNTLQAVAEDSSGQVSDIVTFYVNITNGDNGNGGTTTNGRPICRACLDNQLEGNDTISLGGESTNTISLSTPTENEKGSSNLIWLVMLLILIAILIVFFLILRL